MPKPATARVTSVRTPGVPAAPQGDQAEDGVAEATKSQAENDADNEALISETDMPDVGAPSGTPADLKAYIDAQVAKGVAAGLAAHAKAQRPAAQAVRELPDQSEIDPHAIKDAVLTKQGWVVPHAVGALPQHLRGTNIGV